MIETIVLASLYGDDVLFEADVEDGVAYVTLRVVNGTSLTARASLVDDTGRVVEVEAQSMATGLVSPDPPVFYLPDIGSPNDIRLACS